MKENGLSVYVFGYWEIFKEGQWHLAGNWVQDDAFGVAPVPQNVVPDSWGKFNFNKYYEVSGERGLPDDLSSELRAFMAAFFPELNRPSWMTAAEIVVFAEWDENGRFAHLHLEPFIEQYQLPSEQMRLVFWAE